MAGVRAPRWATCALATIAWIACFAPRAMALEAFDGRIQAHGFVEAQVRGLDSAFEEEFDLAQWYNVINVELEFDILPDGWGPFNLLQAYVRAEARYDCVYTNGCGIFPSVQTYGNDSRDLPLRLRDGRDQDYAGVIDSNSQAVPPGTPLRVNPETRDPTPWVNDEQVPTPIATQPQDFDNDKFYNPNLGAPCPVTRLPSNDTTTAFGCIDNRPSKLEIVPREGFPGFDTLFESLGADGELGDQPDFTHVAGFYQPETTVEQLIAIPVASRFNDYAPVYRGLAFLRDDPAVYLFQSFLDWRFTFREFTGPVPSGTTLPMGPWLPKNFFESLATTSDVANPFRDKQTPTQIFRSKADQAAAGLTSVRASGIRYHEWDCTRGVASAAACRNAPGGRNADYSAVMVGDGQQRLEPVDPRLQKLEALSISTANRGFTFPCFATGGCINLNLSPYPNGTLWGGINGTQLFGGDFSGIVPCWDTVRNVDRGPEVGNSTFVDQISGIFSRKGCIPFTNVRIGGGSGETPLRASPDVSVLAPFDSTVARGLYMPSYGLIQYFKNGGDFDKHEFNISEIDRSFNRGASQQETYELKEAYLDMEFLDSRLWIRAGLQNIVWGKTELFRTTDQFNPQDLALASLPSLEESRIAMLSARAVYSLYTVGPLEDVRVELAANFDRFKPADLGACGEPYTFDIVCALTLGFAFHGIAGVGVAGVDRPPSGWDDIDGVEFGGRIEFRWNRFSFAISDFYGYNDFPYPDPIFFFERSVDLYTGRPLKAGAAKGSCQNAAGFILQNPVNDGTNKLVHSGNWRLENFVSTTSNEQASTRPTGERELGLGFSGFTITPNDDYHRAKEAFTMLGVGTDPDCLKPGGAPGVDVDGNGIITPSVLTPGAENQDIIYPNANLFDPARAPDLGDFLANQPLTEYSSGDVDDSVGAAAGTYIRQTQGQWSGFTVQVPNPNDPNSTITVFSVTSQDYALAYHPANQQLFHFICTGTVSIAIALAPEACAWNLWGTGAQLIGGGAAQAQGPPFSELLSTMFAGTQDGTVAGLIRTIQGATKDDRQGEPVVVPFAPINSDIRDGRTTAVFSLINKSGLWNIGTPQAPFNIPFIKDQSRDQFDLLTLDNGLTKEQKALLGCGPFYGTRCDSGAEVVFVRIRNCQNIAPNPQTDCPEPNPLTTPGNAAIKLGRPPGTDDMELLTTALQFPFQYTIQNQDRTVFCTTANIQLCRVWNVGGGIDFLNMEGSVIIQAFPGLEGTESLPDGSTWTTWAAGVAQPGTVGVPEVRDASGNVTQEAMPFVGGEYCTRYDPGNPQANELGLVRLPGCRGAVSASVNYQTETFDVVFEPTYTPKVDGCVFGRSMRHRDGRTFYMRAVNPDGTLNQALQDELFETCFNNFLDPTIAGNAATPARPNTHQFDGTWYSYTRRNANPSFIYRSPTEPVYGAGTLFHPLADCERAAPGYVNPAIGGPQRIWNPGSPNPPGQNRELSLCFFQFRNLEGDFLEGHASVFRNELAAISWNFLNFLVITSCNNVSGDDDLNDRDCFRPSLPWATGRCSFSAPHFCSNAKAFFSVAGLRRNDVRAGGNPDFGRRDFLWDGGGELVIKYQRRNVFGLSADFAEDVSKTNWGMEFTYWGALPFIDNNSLNAISESDQFNLTVSVDRPTFINFLNANRTFFFNSQWFFQYLPDWNKGFSSSGPFNVLFTFAVFTGYYQDRLLPQFVTVYDFQSQSGGFLPQLAYRFTENLSVTFGISWFIGRGEFYPMALNGFAPPANRAGPHAYEDGTERLLSIFRARDEAFMRLRWTF